MSGLPAAHRSPSRPQKVSDGSLWSDPQWQFDGLRPGLRMSQLRFDWDFKLPDGSRFTAPGRHRWLEDARTFLWSLLTDPPRGRRRLRVQTLASVAQKLRILISWMAGEGMRGFGDLDQENAQRFLGVIAERVAPNGNAITAHTRHAYANIVVALWLQRHKLADPPPEHPFDGERASIFSGFSGSAFKRLPFTPDAIAVPLISKALRLIGEPADDVIALCDQAAPLYLQRREAGFSSSSTRQPVLKLIAAYEFSHIDGEATPWHPPIVGTKQLRFLIDRIYEACFVVISYLVGARVSEILALEADCIERHHSADGAEAFSYLRGRIFKTAADDAGQPHLWAAPQAVVRAIDVLERLSAPLREHAGRSELFLSMQGHGIIDTRPLDVVTSSTLVSRLNSYFAPFVALPDNADGSAWRLTTHQGRKTFARFVGKRDRTGLHALQHHFGHVTRIMTDSAYVGTDFDLGELVDAQTLEETRAALEELLTATHLGGKAGRMLSARSRFRGRTRDGDLSSYVDFLIEESGMRLGVCDWGYCVYRAESAACMGDERGPNPVWRTESVCMSCANFAVTERHRPVWQARLDRNRALIADERLDDASRSLASTRINECERILSDLSASGEPDDHTTISKPA
jgi:integrase